MVNSSTGIWATIHAVSLCMNSLDRTMKSEVTKSFGEIKPTEELQKAVKSLRDWMLKRQMKFNAGWCKGL